MISLKLDCSNRTTDFCSDVFEFGDSPAAFSLPPFPSPEVAKPRTDEKKQWNRGRSPEEQRRIGRGATHDQQRNSTRIAEEQHKNSKVSAKSALPYLRREGSVHLERHRAGGDRTGQQRHRHGQRRGHRAADKVGRVDAQRDL